TFKSAALIGSAIMAALTLFVQIAPDLLIRVFSKDPKVIEVGATYLRITSWNFVANGIVFTCSGMFQGLGNTWPSLLSRGVSIVRFVVPMWWMAAQSWVKIEDFWYLSVGTITMQGVVSFLLVRRELRRRLEFPAAPEVPAVQVA